MMQNQKFKHKTTGAIVEQVPIMEIGEYDEYNGPLIAGDCDQRDGTPNHYEERQERRRERFGELADKNRERSNAEYKKADLSESATGIPFGQPILVGHHSEGRHRRTLERADNAMRRSIDADKKADYYDQRANGIDYAGISSDDPDAVVKLTEKLRTLEAAHAQMKANNKLNRGTHPGWQLSNSSANLRRIRQRIETLKAKPTETTETERAGIRIVENAEDNRIQLIFDGKPPAVVRDILKSHCFRWSRYTAAWQRHLNAAGRYAANQAIGQIEALA